MPRKVPPPTRLTKAIFCILSYDPQASLNSWVSKALWVSVMKDVVVEELGRQYYSQS